MAADAPFGPRASRKIDCPRVRVHYGRCLRLNFTVDYTGIGRDSFNCIFFSQLMPLLAPLQFPRARSPPFLIRAFKSHTSTREEGMEIRSMRYIKGAEHTCPLGTKQLTLVASLKAIGVKPSIISGPLVTPMGDRRRMKTS
uniref:Ribosomal protein S11 n=1 Tax=Plectus sambesii TaxID=2011161 RepID=A0A914XI26_9BILA